MVAVRVAAPSTERAAVSLLEAAGMSVVNGDGGGADVEVSDTKRGAVRVRLVLLVPAVPARCSDALAAMMCSAAAGVVTDAELSLLPNVVVAVERGLRCVTPPVLDLAGQVPRMTQREREVLMLLARGEFVPAIAFALNLSVATVKRVIAALFERFRVHSRVELVVEAERLGLLGDHVPEDPEDAAPKDG